MRTSASMLLIIQLIKVWQIDGSKQVFVVSGEITLCVCVVDILCRCSRQIGLVSFGEVYLFL